jgi:ribosomal protein S18 acetylase RimI-like enzyme
MEYPDTIRRATPSDLPALSETLADALQDDPVISWLFPSEHDRRQRAKQFFMWTLSRTSMPLGEVWMDEECQAAALWAPPDRWRLSPRDQVGLLPSAAALFKGRTPRILVGFNKVEARHPKDPPHWYLYFIGTQTARQGHGFGGALLSHMLARCDEEGTPAYLEASTQRVVPFYARHGFHEIERFALPNGPDWSLMWRDPR